LKQRRIPLLKKKDASVSNAGLEKVKESLEEYRVVKKTFEPGPEWSKKPKPDQTPK